MKTIEQRIRSLEEMISEIHAKVVLGKVGKPTRQEFDEAMARMLAGDPDPMDLYLRRGGEIPEAEPAARRPYTRRRK